MSLLEEAQLFTSGDNKVVEASREYSDTRMTAKEYIKITLDNASAPTTAQVEYQMGVSGNGMSYSATYKGDLNKQNQ
ncbi:unknown [Brachyspira sp. CAG:700]|nr:unknown [Brachyspira sp. CAG:700]